MFDDPESPRTFCALAALVFLVAVIAYLALPALVETLRATSHGRLRGAPLVGAVATVVIAIPARGVGAVTVVANGKRVRVPAKALEAGPISTGETVLIVKAEKRFVCVDLLPGDLKEVFQ